MDEELFELCKEVYEKTLWNVGIDKGIDTVWCHGNITRLPIEIDTSDFHQHVPLYTSDYLLEKLPIGVQVHKDSDEYGAYRPPTYGVTPVGKARTSGRIRWNADTPLKALLKLTIALSEEGVKL